MAEPTPSTLELERIRALRQTGLVNNRSEARFDRLTRLAQQVLQAPISVISLIDEHRQWFKSSQGLDPGESERSASFCRYTIDQDEIFEVTDAREDPRFANHALVQGKPFLRFYAGAPLRSRDGHRIGTLSILSDTPRTLSAEERNLLRDLAESVESEINHQDSEVQQEALQFAQALGHAISNAQAHFIRDVHRKSAFEALLADLLDLTGSEMGFIGEVLFGKDQSPELHLIAFSCRTQRESVQQFFDRYAGQQLVLSNPNSLISQSIARGESLVTGNPQTHLRPNIVQPLGHPELSAFMGVPVTYGGEVIAMFGLSNRPDGYNLDLVDRLKPLTDTIGQLIDADRTRRRHQMAQLELERLKSSLDQTLDCVFMFETGGLKIFYANDGALKLAGLDRDALFTTRADQLIDPAHQTKFQETIKAMSQCTAPPKTFDTRIVNASGAMVAVEVFLQCFKNPGQPTHFVAIVRDISERLKQEARLRYLATHDSLTNLPNRALFLDRLSAGIDEAQRHAAGLCVLLLDLDNFKVVNDGFGHLNGDRLLIEVSSRLSRGIRSGDMVARLGGDEFAAIITTAGDNDEALMAAERLLNLISQPVNIENEEIIPTASIGYCLFPDDGSDSETLLRNADLAMYQAKRSGRNQIRAYSSDMEESSREQLHVLQRLRSALENDQLELHYQPQVNALTGEIIALEALLRWHDEVLGVMPPDRFIPIAESSGLILPLGRWVFEQVCKQVARWHYQGRSVRVAFNLSPLQFRQLDLVTNIKKTSARCRCPVHLLEIELTESAAMQSPEFAKQQFARLAEAGFSIALDDFGTGHSSLSRLGRLKVNKLKIDQSFVDEVPGNKMHETLVRTTIGLGKEMGLSLVAEGVETEAQKDFLVQHGCHVYQGWLFSPAVTVSEFESRLANGDWTLADDCRPAKGL